MDARQGDVAWAVIVAAVIAYELAAEDMLSESTHRACGRHPIVTRLAIGAVAGHLARLMPPTVDVFDARNVVHRWCVQRYRWARTRGNRMKDGQR